MLTDEIFQDRVERLVTAGRAVLAVVSLVGTWLDPVYSAPTTYLLLSGYAVYALIIAVLQWLHHLRAGFWAIATHIVDLGVFMVLLYLTEGPTSPFYPFLIFGLLAATLRWRWRGAMWTTGALLVLYVASAFSVSPSLLYGETGVQRFLIRTAQLGVVGATLALFGYYQERISRDVLRLRSTPLDPGDGDALPTRQAAEYVAMIYKARRAVLAWNDPEEPWLSIVDWRDGAVEETHVAAHMFEPLVDAQLGLRPFVYRSQRGSLYYDEAGQLVAGPDAPINPAFLERFDLGSVIVLPLSAQGVEGRMFIAKERIFSSDALAMAAALDPQITAAFDKAAALASGKRAVSSEQRLKLARDLHDGVLQFLAGANMQIESIISNPREGEVREKLRALQDALVTEQRELRTFIRRLRPGFEHVPTGEMLLEPDLKVLAERLESQWRVVVNLTLNPPNVQVPARLQYDIHQLVREAIANAVRHGKARWINISANRQNDILHLTIADDGCGFNVHGVFDTWQQIELKVGPRSLRERVMTLGGTIVVTSASLGSVVSMSIPLTDEPRTR